MKRTIWLFAALSNACRTGRQCDRHGVQSCSAVVSRKQCYHRSRLKQYRPCAGQKLFQMSED